MAKLFFLNYLVFELVLIPCDLLFDKLIILLFALWCLLSLVSGGSLLSLLGGGSFEEEKELKVGDS